MCVLLERGQQRRDLIYESDVDKTDEEIIAGLTQMTALSLSSALADEPTYE